jgi:hypoxanthine phosphoribosyltransferase
MPAEQGELPAGFPAADEILSAAEVEAGLARLAAAIQPEINAGDLILLGVMTGGMYPLIQLAVRLEGDFVIDYCHATRYRGELQGGELDWVRPPAGPLRGRSVVIVDDIWDAGLTLTAVADYCRSEGASRVSTAALFIKDRARNPAIGEPDLDAGLHVPDRYVFGCGMDLHERWRHLRSVYALREGAA